MLLFFPSCHDRDQNVGVSPTAATHEIRTKRPDAAIHTEKPQPPRLTMFPAWPSRSTFVNAISARLTQTITARFFIAVFGNANLKRHPGLVDGQ